MRGFSQPRLEPAAFNRPLHDQDMSREIRYGIEPVAQLFRSVENRELLEDAVFGEVQHYEQAFGATRAISLWFPVLPAHSQVIANHRVGQDRLDLLLSRGCPEMHDLEDARREEMIGMHTRAPLFVGIYRVGGRNEQPRNVRSEDMADRGKCAAM